ncbi:hypothetical protein SAMN05444401_3943 [Clostridium amylolyticum]|uniref:Calcineurin-like phosphoesterase domain-containing protein n=1 Tax=Clostridium amylolyticum TaxID=1121298 RepID=A0A1M6MC97_9CLOT|nr:metallophosphoesterase [Clostridium amylolyticum]SHJ81138.1 hypothetical protein SAMN05444401_3943 [Clostridium amylolyticum]
MIEYFIALIIIAAIAVFLYLENNWIKINRIKHSPKNLPREFMGMRIVHLSDMHSKSFGQGNNNLLKRVKELNPDIIVFTGDLIDSRRYEEEVSSSTMASLVNIAPVYYVIGNHEARRDEYDNSLQQKLINSGVKVLRNHAHIIEKKGQSFYILGVDDPYKDNRSYSKKGKDSEVLKRNINEALEKITEERAKDTLSQGILLKKGKGLSQEMNSIQWKGLSHESIPKNRQGLSKEASSSKNHFTLLLSHRPEQIETYAQCGIDLVFSGHAHGGQMRIPFTGQGGFAPNQGKFPKYTSGIHMLGDTALVISRGLGNSSFPFRVFNRPEIVLVELV